MNTQLVNIIFGMKVRQARTEAGLNLTEFAAQCDLSSSYVTEIEKGRKYPRADKIMRMAEVLGRAYDDLVSIRLEPPLTHLGSALSSPVLGQFPFEEFGIEMSDLVGVLTRAPDKASALLHAISELGREYDMQEQKFLWSALRSYQELHDNYFPDLEDAAAKYARKKGLWGDVPLQYETLADIIEQDFGIRIDRDRLLKDPLFTGYRTIFVKGARPQLLINTDLHPYQINFALAREIGYQVLKLSDRSNTSSPDQIESFQQVFNDFKASFFAGALLMPRQAMINDIQMFFNRKTWSPQPLMEMIQRYGVSPEALMYRFSELVPEFFGLPLHFLRVHQSHGGRYRLVKQLNLNRLRVPNGLAVDEHFCRHWLVIRLIRELEAEQAAGKTHGLANPLVGVQMSHYIDSQDRFLCFGFARPSPLDGQTNTCGIIGFRAEAGLSKIIKFADDLLIPEEMINETCERCSLSAAQCGLRAAPPTVLEARKLRQDRKQALRELAAEMRS
ncbi:MAG: XRE family transcriptional regulator [Ardenticatenaceae bacterium]|nr:XRE family transcriptional regulator [Ardenticatenaceae bacterium]